MTEFKRNPWTFLSIPIVAGLVGYITNLLGVKMLFYPIKYLGLNIWRWPEQPLGVLGWQGIVPCKRHLMANRMVDVTITRLLSVPEVFSTLQPQQMARLLAPTIRGSILGGWVPLPILHFFLQRTARDMLRNIESVVDIRHLVVNGMTTDPAVLGSFFQKVAAKELAFLINSGMGFGFLLGLLQMVQWMLFPANWTLPAGGAIVGYITNWIALKWIFEPLEPVKFGPWILHGMFLQRQPEVSADFSAYISRNILTSERVWQSVLKEKTEAFSKIVSRNVPLPPSGIARIVSAMKDSLGGSPEHPLHLYTNAKLGLEATLIERMNRLTPTEFEQVLHPIFQEDELTLILAGGVLGAIAGALQLWFNLWTEKQAKERRKKDSESIK